jgi:hypothetical protein
MVQSDKTYIYTFLFPDGEEKLFHITLDASAHYRNSSQEAQPEWTRLPHHQCPHCLLTTADASHCPIAVNLADLVAAFQDTVSYRDCTVSCVGSERTVTKDTSVQDGLSSIMGIIMATSGCPTLDLLRPMAWFHLPFATIDESLFRSASTYLLRQYFEVQQGEQPDFSLGRIKAHYARIERVTTASSRGSAMPPRSMPTATPSSSSTASPRSSASRSTITSSRCGRCSDSKKWARKDFKERGR